VESLAGGKFGEFGKSSVIRLTKTIQTFLCSNNLSSYNNFTWASCSDWLLNYRANFLQAFLLTGLAFVEDGIALLHGALRSGKLVSLSALIFEFVS